MEPSMSATAAISRDKVLTGPQLHQAVDQYVNHSIVLHVNVLLTVMCRDRLTADAQSGYNVHQNRDSFQERALRDVTMSSNDSALMLDPNNPILVREEMKAQKVSLFPFFLLDIGSWRLMTGVGLFSKTEIYIS